MIRQLTSVIILTALLATASAGAQIGDPPGRVGRISEVQGRISLKAVGTSGWVPATVNYPLSSGDALWVTDSSRAEIHVGSSALRLAPSTAVTFDSIGDHLIQLHLTQGTALVQVQLVDRDDDYQIITPSGSLAVRGRGRYRIDVTPDGRRSTVTMREGDADVSSGGTTYRLAPASSTTLTGSGRSPIAMGPLVSTDASEQWADSLAAAEDNATSARYVARDLVGYEDLDAAGDWRTDATYGAVWQPRVIPAGWSPYRFGHWESVGRWGWTWMADEPWGFATSHYGRWTRIGSQWFWLPGAQRARPAYAPALVAFLSSTSWNTTLSFGRGGGIGWLPLGPGEPFIPAYHASALYLRSLNYNYLDVAGYNFAPTGPTVTHYLNYGIPGAVVVVPQYIFVGALPVGRYGITVRREEYAGVRPSSHPTIGDVAVSPVRTVRTRTGAAESPASWQAPPAPAPRSLPAPASTVRDDSRPLATTPNRSVRPQRATPPAELNAAADTRPRTTPARQSYANPAPLPRGARPVVQRAGNSPGTTSPQRAQPLTRQRAEASSGDGPQSSSPGRPQSPPAGATSVPVNPPPGTVTRQLRPRTGGEHQL